VSIRKINVALVGCGAVSRLYYVPALQELTASGALQVVLVVDPNAENAARIHAAFPGAARARDLGEISRHGVDLAIVASPHSRHAEQTLQLLKSGVAVLCEKPMATSVADAEAMVAAASLSSKLAIGMVRRFFPATQMIRRILALEVLGNLTSFHFSEGESRFNWPVASVSYFTRREAHGGVLMDIGVHALDLMIDWFGEPAEMEYQDDAMGGIEVNCRLQCRYAGGLAGVVRLSRDCALANQYTIRGTKGWLTWKVNDAANIEMGFDGTRHVLNAALRETSPDHAAATNGRPGFNFEQSFVSQLCNVIGSMNGTEELRVPASEAIKSLRLIEHCYRNRTLLEMPWLSEHEARPAAQLNARNPDESR
jgi:predicted dehydrogenase